jgi:signal peptidase I
MTMQAKSGFSTGRRHGRLREIVFIALMLVGILAGRSSLADHYVVPSGSMQHTLQPGDRVLVDKRAYGLRLPFTAIAVIAGDPVERGDVVIFDSPADGTRLIKRIVAIGGDRVSLAGGRLVVNGQPLATGDRPDIEWHGDTAVALRLSSGGGPDVKGLVPEGQLLALGDHRGNSRDSRYFGFVDAKSVYARALGVYWRRGEGVVWKRL